jgi:hypothetical protein
VEDEVVAPYVLLALQIALPGDFQQELIIEGDAKFTKKFKR